MAAAANRRPGCVSGTGWDYREAMSDFRTERDSMGEMQVPADAYYGAQTQRAAENFPISGQPIPPALISVMIQSLSFLGCPPPPPPIRPLHPM